MKAEEKTVFDMVQKSLFTMVVARVTNIVITPFVLLIALFQRFYRVFFWSDARWIKYQVIMHILYRYTQWIFKDMTEEEIEAIQGIDVRLIFKEKQNGERKADVHQES